MFSFVRELFSCLHLASVAVGCFLVSFREFAQFRVVVVVAAVRRLALVDSVVAPQAQLALRVAHVHVA